MAGILSACDELMENSQRRIQIIEAMARALYREWFVHFRIVGMDGDFHMCVRSSGHTFQNQRVARFASNGEIGNLHLFLAPEKPIQEFNKAIVGTTVAHLGDVHSKTIQIVWPPATLRANLWRVKAGDRLVWVTATDSVNPLKELLALRACALVLGENAAPSLDASALFGALETEEPPPAAVGAVRAGFEAAVSMGVPREFVTEWLFGT